MGTDISKILYKKIYDAFVVKSIKEREQYPFTRNLYMIIRKIYYRLTILVYYKYIMKGYDV